MPYYNDPEENLALRRALRTGYNTAPDYNPALNKWQTTLGFESARHGFKANEYYEQALTAREENDIQKENYFRLLAEAEEREAARKAPNVQNASDIRGVGDLVDWGLGAVGQAAASAEPVIGGIAGRLAGAGLGALTGPAAPLMVPLLSNAGGFLGAAIPGYQMERNETIGEAMRNDPENKLSTEDIRAASRGKGVAAGAMEAVVPFGVARGLTSPLSKALPKGLANGISRGSLIETGLAEGLTEGAQSLIGQSAQKYLQGQPMFSDFDWVQAANEAAAGAVGGVGLAAPVKGVNYAREKFFASPEAQQGRQDGANLAGAAIDAGENVAQEAKGFGGAFKNAWNKYFGSKAENTAEPTPNATPEPGVGATAQAGMNEEAAAQQTQGISGAQDYVNKNKYTQNRGLYFKDGQPYEVDTGWHATNKTKFDPDHPEQKARNGIDIDLSQEEGIAQSDYWLDKQGRPATYKGRPVTKAQGIRASLTRHFKGVNEANKNIFIANNVEEVLQTMGQDPHAMELAQAIQADPNSATNYKAFTTTNADGSPRVVMIANNIKQGEEFGVFLHEVGVHVGMRNAFSGFEVNKIAESVRSLAQDSDPITRQIAEKALARAEGTNRLDEEVVAYFVEEAMRATDADGKPVYQPKALKQKQSKWRQVLDKVISLIKQFLSKLGVKPKTPLTPQQIIDTAFGLAQKESQNLAQQSVVEETATQPSSTIREGAKNVNDMEMLNLAKHLFDETAETQAMTVEDYDDTLVAQASEIANKIQSQREQYIPEIQEAVDNFLSDQNYETFFDQITAFTPRQITAWQVEEIYKDLGVGKETAWSIEEMQAELADKIPPNVREIAEAEADEFFEQATASVQKQWNKQGETTNTYYKTAGIIRENPLPALNLDEREQAFLGTIFTAIHLQGKGKVDYGEIVNAWRSVYGNRLLKLFDNIERFYKKKYRKIQKVEPFIAEDEKGTDIEKQKIAAAKAAFKEKQREFRKSRFAPLDNLRNTYYKKVNEEADNHFSSLLENELFNSTARKNFALLAESNGKLYNDMRKKAKELLYAYTMNFEPKHEKIRIKDSSAYEMTPSVADQFGSVITKLDLAKMGEYFARMIDDLNAVDNPHKKKLAPLFVKMNTKDGEENRRPLDWKEWRKALIATMSGNEKIRDAIRRLQSEGKFNPETGQKEPLKLDPWDSGYMKDLQEKWIKRADEESRGGEKRLGLNEAAEFLWREYRKTQTEVASTDGLLQRDFDELFDRGQVDRLFLTNESFEDTIPWLDDLLFAENPLRNESGIDNSFDRFQESSEELLDTQLANFDVDITTCRDMISAELNGEEFVQKDEGLVLESQIDDEISVETIDDLFNLADNKREEMLNADDENLIDSRGWDKEMQLTKNESNGEGGFQVSKIQSHFTVIPSIQELGVFQAFEAARKEFNEGNYNYDKEEPQLNTTLLANIGESIPLQKIENWLTADNKALNLYLAEKTAQNVEWRRVSPLLGSLFFVSSDLGNLDPTWVWKQPGLKKKILAYAVPNWTENYLKEDHPAEEKKRVQQLFETAFDKSQYTRLWTTTNLEAALELAKIMSQDESKFMIVLNEHFKAGGDSMSVALPNIRTSVRYDQQRYLLGAERNSYLENNILAVVAIENQADNSVFFETTDEKGQYTKKGVNLTKLTGKVRWKDKRFRNEDPNVRDWENPNDTGAFSLLLASLGNYLYVDPNANGRISWTVTPYQQEKAGIAQRKDGGWQTFEIVWNPGPINNRGIDTRYANDKNLVFDNNGAVIGYVWNGKELIYGDPNLTDEEFNVLNQVWKKIYPVINTTPNTYELMWRTDSKGKIISGLPPYGVKWGFREILFDNPELEGQELEIATKVKAVIFPTMSDLRELDYPGNKEELLKKLPITGIPKFIELIPKTQEKHPFTVLEATIRSFLQQESYNKKAQWSFGGDLLTKQADFWSMGKALFEHSQYSQEENKRFGDTHKTMQRYYVNKHFGYNVQDGFTEKDIGEWSEEQKAFVPRTIKLDNFADENLFQLFFKHRFNVPEDDGKFLKVGPRTEQAKAFAQKRLGQLHRKLSEDLRQMSLNPKNDFSVPVEFELTPPDNKEFKERARKYLIEQYFKVNDDLNPYLAENTQVAEKWADEKLNKLSKTYKQILKVKPANALQKISDILDKTFYQLEPRTIPGVKGIIKKGNNTYTNNQALNAIGSGKLPPAKLGWKNKEKPVQQPLKNKYRQFGKDGLLIDPNNIIEALFAPLFDLIEAANQKDATIENDANTYAMQSIRNALEALNSRDYKNNSLGFYVAKDGSMRVTAKMPKQLMQDLVDLWYEISASQIQDPHTETWIWNSPEKPGELSGDQKLEYKKYFKQRQLLAEELKNRGFEQFKPTDKQLAEINSDHKESEKERKLERFGYAYYKKIKDSLPKEEQEEIDIAVQRGIHEWAQENKGRFGHALQKQHGFNTLLDYSKFKEEKDKKTREIRQKILRKKGHDGNFSFEENDALTKEINREVIEEVDKWEQQQKAKAFLPLFKHDIENLGRELMAALRMGQRNQGTHKKADKKVWGNSKTEQPNVFGKNERKVITQKTKEGETISNLGATSRAQELWGEAPTLIHTPSGDRIEEESAWHHNFHKIETLVGEVEKINSGKDEKETDEKGREHKKQFDATSDRYGMVKSKSGKFYFSAVPRQLKDLRITSTGIAERAHDFTDDTMGEQEEIVLGRVKQDEDIFNSGATPSINNRFELRNRSKEWPDLNNEIVDRDYVRLLNTVELKPKRGVKEPEKLPAFTSKDVVSDVIQRLENIKNLSDKKQKLQKNFKAADEMALNDAEQITLQFDTDGIAATRQGYINALIGKKENGEWVKKGFLPLIYPQEEGETSGQYAQRLISIVDLLIKNRSITAKQIDGRNAIDVKWEASSLAGLVGLDEEELSSKDTKYITDAYTKGTLMPGRIQEEKDAQAEYENQAFGETLNDWDNVIVDEKKRAQKLRSEATRQIAPINIKFDPRSSKPENLFHPAQYAPMEFELPDGKGDTISFTSPLQAFRVWQSGKPNQQILFQRTSGNKRATFTINTNTKSVAGDEALDTAAIILAEAYKQNPEILEALIKNNFYKDNEFVFDLEGWSRHPRFWEENYPNVLRTALFRVEQDLRSNPEIIEEAEQKLNERSKDRLWKITKDMNKDQALNVLTKMYTLLNDNPNAKEIQVRTKYYKRSDGELIGTTLDEKGNKIVNPNAPIYNELKTIFDSIFAVDSQNFVNDLSHAERKDATPPQQIGDWWYTYLTPRNAIRVLENYLYSEIGEKNFNGVALSDSAFNADGVIQLAKMIMEGGSLEELAKIDSKNNKEVIKFYKSIMGEGESSALKDIRAYFKEHGLLLKNEQLNENTTKQNFRDDVPFSKLLMETPLDPKERADSAVDWISKVLPKDTIVNILKEEEWGKQGFDKDTYGNFTEKDGKKVISLALSGDVLSTAHHEAAHAMLSVIKKFSPKHYDKLISLSQKYKDVVLKVLHDKHAANAIKDVENNPEELASYAYQLWMAGLIPSNALSKRVAGRIGRMWLRVAGLFNDALRRQSKETDSILEAETKLMLVYKRFNDGMLGPEHSEESFYRQLEADLNATKMQERWNKVANFIGKYADQLVNASDTVLRRADIPELTEIADMFYVDVVDHDMSSMHEKGEKGGALSRYRQLRFKWENAYNRIIEDLDEKEKNKIRHALLMKDTDEALRSLEGNQKLQKGYKEMREFFNNVFKEIHEKPGVNYKNQGNYEAHFFPFLWNREAIKKNRQEFTEMLMEELKKEGLGDHYILDKDGGRIKVSALENAERYVAEILGENMPAGQNKEQPFWIKKGTFEQNVEARYLGFIKDRPKFDKFFEQSLDTVMHEYLVRSSKNAIFQEVFGNNGEKLRDLFEKATAKVAKNNGLFNPLGEGIFRTTEFHDIHNLSEKIGAGELQLADKYKGREKEISESIVKLKELMAPYYRAVDSMSGMLGTDMSPQMRKFNAIGVTYQNIRLLLTVLFSSFQDIAGLSFHGGTLKDQWDGFRRAVREAFGVAAKKKSKDFWIKRAEEFGIVAPLSSIGMVQELVGTQHLTGFWGKVNKVFFRINGMEGWNRGLRAQSMIIAERKIKEWAETKALDPDIPTDGLLFKRCFGSQMKPGDIELERGEDGKMYVANNEANRIAMARIVDDMIMNPTEANRPMWANDPRFMLFAQLKTFSYTLHRVMLRGVAEQLRLGNYAPATAALMGMVPMAFTGYVIKEMILGMIDDDDDDWKFQLQNLIPYSINRSGIGGIPQMYLEDILDVDPARLFGPTVDQVQNILSIPLRGWNPEYLPGRVSHMHNWNNEFVAALPGGTLLKRVPGLVDQSA